MLTKNYIQSVFVFSFVIALTACNSTEKIIDQRIQGTWFSNKELTLKNIEETNVKLDEELFSYLKRNLGDLGYSYDGSIMTVTFKSMPNEKIPSVEFEIIESDGGSITIKNKHGANAKFYFEGNCYYIFTTGFKEYFCK